MKLDDGILIKAINASYDAKLKSKAKFTSCTETAIGILSSTIDLQSDRSVCSDKAIALEGFTVFKSQRGDIYQAFAIEHKIGSTRVIFTCNINNAYDLEDAEAAKIAIDLIAQCSKKV
jgi:hypothetical protein